MNNTLLIVAAAAGLYFFVLRKRPEAEAGGIPGDEGYRREQETPVPEAMPTKAATTGPGVPSPVLTSRPPTTMTQCQCIRAPCNCDGSKQHDPRSTKTPAEQDTHNEPIGLGGIKVTPGGVYVGPDGTVFTPGIGGGPAQVPAGSKKVVRRDRREEPKISNWITRKIGKPMVLPGAQGEYMPSHLGVGGGIKGLWIRGNLK